MPTILGVNYFGRREKTPTPKTRVSIWTLLRTPGRFTTRPLPVYFTTKMSVVRPFSVLSKDEIGPHSKTGRFLSKAEILGVGVFSPLPIIGGVSGAKKSTQTFFCTKFFKNPSGHGRPRQKSWTSAPKSAFFCGPGDGEKLFDPGSSGRKGQECPREIRTKKFMFMLFFRP